MDKLLDPREYLPHYYMGVREIDIIADAIIYILSNLNREMQIILANNFVQTANEAGIAKYEKILGIVADPALDLETRRQRVLSKMAASTVFTLRVLETNLKEICDNGEYILNMNYDTFFMDIKVRVGKKGMLDVLYDLLYTMLPAHVGFYLHNHLPAISTGELFYAAAVSFRYIYRATDTVYDKGDTSLDLYPGGAVSIKELRTGSDTVMDILASALDVAPGSAVSISIQKDIRDAQNQQIKTEQVLSPGMAIAHARIISKK